MKGYDFRYTNGLVATPEEIEGEEKSEEYKQLVRWINERSSSTMIYI